MKTTATEKKTDIRVERTYRKLANTFFEIMRVKPYESISIIEICERANVHRATFYKHFIDKQDFLNFCVERKFDELNIAENGFLPGTTQSKDAYLQLLSALIDFVAENKPFISNIYNDANRTMLTEAIESSLSEFIEKKLNYVLNEYYKQIIPIPLISNFYSGAVVATLKWWVLFGEDYSKNDILEFFARRYDEASFSYKKANKPQESN